MDEAAAIQGMVDAYKVRHPQKGLQPGRDFLPHAGKVTAEIDIRCLSESVLDAWFTTGKFAALFERQLQDFYQLRSASLVNSGSSANLVALSALTSVSLGEKRIKPGDEVITVAAGFPTTVNPIIQNGAVPVFLDIEIPSYNMNTSKLDEALTPKTRAVMIAHTLGNPFGLKKIKDFCNRNNLWLIEDNCDAFGSKYNGQLTGTFGDISTLSFYPAHHITTGEGGAVLTNSPKLRVLLESFRDWGRDCYCAPGKDNSCFKRFSQQLGGLPFGYDHKFAYSHIGYNLKMTDMQAALGYAQMQQVDSFIEKRVQNWNYLRSQLVELEDVLILPEKEVGSEPSWFGFAMTIRESSTTKRHEILNYLADKKVGTRLLFAGDLTKQPSFENIKHRTIGPLSNTNKVTEDTFWVGCWPGLNEIHLDYITESIKSFFRS
jgi:CDP-6-deoxy-D-xylo-4-hexulose-3-dehydrase